MVSKYISRILKIIIPVVFCCAMILSFVFWDKNITNPSKKQLVVYENSSNNQDLTEETVIFPSFIESPILAKAPPVNTKVVNQARNATTTQLPIQEPNLAITETISPEIKNEAEFTKNQNLIIAYNPISNINDNIIKSINQAEIVQEDLKMLNIESTNLSKNGILALNQSLVFTLPAKSDLLALNAITIEPQAAFTTTINNRTATINGQFERDQNYKIGIKSFASCTLDLDNQNCFLKNTDWVSMIEFKSSVREDSVIGYSVENRPINAYKFGRCRDQNCTKIMLNGGIHGNEWRSGDLTQLVDYITNNPQFISGQNKEILIIPFSNPDGTAYNQRYNTRNVDLNRNFSAYWANCVQCGASADSEPETRALRDATLSFNPKYVISYHAQWPPNGIIFRGDDNNSNSVRFSQYAADRTGYPVGAFPDFDIVPGDQTVWTESLGIASLILESTLIPNSDWNKNLPLYQSLLSDTNI
jgi:hypothetical protein